jgi:endonuclease/exonuclease/phosphatase family metal-dependent hydrolase
MKNLIILLILCFSIPLHASVRVMTFNTTCSICEKGKFDKFKYRKHWIVDTIKRANPDIISMQEVLIPSQLRWFKKQLKDYKLTYYRKFYIFAFADPALFVRANRFSINKSAGFWLGPRRGKFSLGWKRALPRRIQYNILYDKKEEREFLFIGSHFDNKEKNKTNSAKMLIQRFVGSELPIIVAADTNLKPKTDGFKNLLNHFDDSYELSKKISFLKNTPTDKDDSCNLEKGLIFPACRVDHILLSNKHNWAVSDWVIDQFKYGKNNRFNSDHRALYADIEFK